MAKKKRLVLTLLALLVICFPLAFDLGQAPIQTWDEARQAVNALEMLRSGGQWLVTTFNQQPDLENTKPPLLIWLQALSMAGFGPTELAVRLPSLLASVGTVALLYVAGRGVGRLGWGLLAGAVLTTMPGYLGPHLARTGDYEALLCFWVLGQVLATFAYAETGRLRYLTLAAVAVAAAVLTKGVAGLLGLPALALYLLLQHKLLGTLRRPAFWLAAASSLAVPALYYVLRERAGPGYWAAVWGHELGGRYGHNLAVATESPLYYVRNLVRFQCRLWWPWLLPAGWLLASSPPTAGRRLAGLLSLFLLDWLLIISSAKTKAEWYTAPMLPALALLLALGLGTGYQRAQARWLGGRRSHWRPGVAVAAALLLLAVPYALAMRRLVRERHDNTTWGGVNGYGTYLRHYRPAPVPVAPLVVYYPVDYRHGAWSSQFYQETLAERGVAISRCNPDSLPPLTAGRRVLVCLPQVRASLLRRYAVRLLDQREVCTLYEVRGPASAVPPAP